jgi:hypothetical protein
VILQKDQIQGELTLAADLIDQAYLQQATKTAELQAHLGQTRASAQLAQSNLDAFEREILAAISKKKADLDRQIEAFLAERETELHAYQQAQVETLEKCRERMRAAEDGQVSGLSSEIEALLQPLNFLPSSDARNSYIFDVRNVDMSPVNTIKNRMLCSTAELRVAVQRNSALRFVLPNYCIFK